MGVSISGSNSISGLSGNDTNFDKVLENLKKIESTQLNKLEAWKSDWKLRYDAFTQIIEQIQAANSMLSQLGDKNNFVTKLVQSSNDNVITAVANASAQDVQHTIKVSQTASNAIWANTGKVFSSKTDVINKTGGDEYFKYRYAGKEHSFKVPANTTLESFASMINNSSDNPGIKVSLIQTGNGYVFQVAGKDTGVDNDLYIYASNLEGMKADNSKSNWVSNTALDMDAKVTNPTSYTFDLVLQGGTTKSFPAKGDMTADELVSQLAGLGVKVKFNNATGELELDGVQSFTKRASTADAYVPASTKIDLKGGAPTDKLSDSIGAAVGDEFVFTLTMDDGSERNVRIAADATYRDLAAAFGQMVADDKNKVELGLNNGRWSIDVPGVSKIKLDVVDSTGNSTPVSSFDTQVEKTNAKGERNPLGASLDKAELKLSFDKDSLDKRLGNQKLADDDPVSFIIVGKDGKQNFQFELKAENTYEDFAEQLSTVKDSNGKTLADLGYTVSVVKDVDGKITSLSIDGAREIRVTSGSLDDKPGYETSLKAGITINAQSNPADPEDTAHNLFYQNSDGSFTLEKAPDLVYTIATNDGKTGTLTLASGSKMPDVIAAMQNPGSAGWVWKDGDGNPAAAPSDLGVRFTDKNGKEYLDAAGQPLKLEDIDGPIYLNFSNIQTASGPQITGQLSETDNWSIQRSANAVYQVDNWPIEMESTSNNISDVIEGVVFNIHETGEARISISTDITSVEQSIQNYLDAVNSVLLTVNELMKYDETKEVTSNDPNDIGNSNYSASGLTNQKGNLLTGNYGVQLFKSRFTSVLTTTPPGFKAQSSASDILSGDVLASLANLGIKTDTDSTSDTYGLLVLAPSSGIAELQSIDRENYDKMITNNLEAVVDFFCAAGIGSSTSTDFRYGSHVQGITKAGVYDVTYRVTDDGEIVDVMVGGEPAKRDESMAGNYFSVASGDPRGLSILIDDLSVGDHPPVGEPAMQVRIKQGLVQTTQEFLKGELVFNDVNISANSTESQIADAMHLKEQNGALMSLRDNYMKVMENIDAKIEREQQRIDLWYTRQKTAFANLETLLTQYSQQQSSLESQLKQLSGNS